MVSLEDLWRSAARGSTSLFEVRFDGLDGVIGV